MAGTHLTLVDVPSEVQAPDLAQARPLGTRAQLAARLADLLPGTTFDSDGRGSFRRGAYEIVFVIPELEPVRIDAEIDRPEAWTSLKRIADKTGWRVRRPRRAGLRGSRGQPRRGGDRAGRCACPSRGRGGRHDALASRAVRIDAWAGAVSRPRLDGLELDATAAAGAYGGERCGNPARIRGGVCVVRREDRAAKQADQSARSRLPRQSDRSAALRLSDRIERILVVGRKTVTSGRPSS